MSPLVALMLGDKRMEDKFAIKHPNAWLWQSNLKRADVVSRLETNQIFRDWLVCPQGLADHAVTVGQFVDDPTVFERHERQRRQIIAAVEKPLLLTRGEQLIQLFCICLMVGGATVNIFFPHMLGAGLTPTTLAILIPIWSIGGIGVVAWILGRFQHAYRVRVALKRMRSQVDQSPGALQRGD